MLAVFQILYGTYSKDSGSEQIRVLHRLPYILQLLLVKKPPGMVAHAGQNCRDYYRDANLSVSVSVCLSVSLCVSLCLSAVSYTHLTLPTSVYV